MYIELANNVTSQPIFLCNIFILRKTCLECFLIKKGNKNK